MRNEFLDVEKFKDSIAIPSSTLVELLLDGLD